MGPGSLIWPENSAGCVLLENASEKHLLDWPDASKPGRTSFGLGPSGAADTHLSAISPCPASEGASNGVIWDSDTLATVGQLVTLKSEDAIIAHPLNAAGYMSLKRQLRKTSARAVGTVPLVHQGEHSIGPLVGGGELCRGT